ncbi:hypothetical protein SAMN02745883_01856 [Caminicella sporogenes DSM 14501]|uniref:Uncharacterized protein n=1 Tax=Caminicella sporogenes DSM 14501 TaxID=1121266 RepID=A0A1M6RRA7_9FIRM|nr:CBO2463/CBO2479 domain-containing protein [Caminicella sporogenes]RKD23669.1 hypothetical protein BET04_04545 [Caminicella sporogenes]WIF94012.1 CBO2463/CBO2479 domain-containing protein [Caminicella sporogenes]SHK35012.1 hypothetical protein SAMN02745883_01856 [Caminicella sporogenes DSM 14501]
MDRLKYGFNTRFFEGVIVEIKDGLVGIDLKGRIGHLRVPKRMLITDYDLKLGQEVGFFMSYPEVLSGEVNQKYVDNIERDKKRKEEGK